MRQSIMVAAARQDGGVERYSNPGSNNLISAPVNRTGFGNTWTSDVTDLAGNAGDNRGYTNGNLTTGFNGTSAAAPMVSGVVALMLEANPNLDWRNTQHILIDTAQKNGLIDLNGDGILDGGDGNSDGVIDNFNQRNTFAGNANYDTDGDGNGLIDLNGDGIPDGNVDPYHTGWFQNAAGNWVSDNFGFGMLDANAAVQVAAGWTPVLPELSVNSMTKTIITGALAEGNLGALNSVNNVDTFVTESNLTVEWVEVTINATVADQDDLMLVLQSPSGTQSVLMAPGGSTAQTDVDNFTFSSNQFWDENASGIWTLQALDTGVADGQASTIDDWQISIHGTCAVVSPLIVNSLAHPLASLGKFASLALSAGGLDPTSYTINNVNQVGDSASMGVFSNGTASGLPLDQGLLFTSGKVVDAIGPNDQPDTSTSWSNPGHSLLDGLTGQATLDASGLEIYFTPTEDVTISYDFLFGSEEFDEWVGTVFNDGAGIFITALKSPSDEFQNGFTPTNISQTFNGADLAVNQLATKSQNGGVSGKYYDSNPCCGDMNWEYDGSSLLSHSSAIPLKAGAHYYIGMMVADASDGIYDSALAIGLDGSGVKASELFNIATKPLPFPIDAGRLPFEFKPGDFARQQRPPFMPLPGSKDPDLLRQQRGYHMERIPAAPIETKSTKLDAWKFSEQDHAKRRESLVHEQVDAVFKEFDSVEGIVRFGARRR
jgi:subtilisin-like proprotein convertase family protein